LTVYLHEFRALAGASLANVRAQRERYAQLVAETVGRGVRLGEFETADVGIASLGLLGMCNWVCQWYQPGGRLAPAQIGGYFADLVLGGLVRSSASSRTPARPESRQTRE